MSASVANSSTKVVQAAPVLVLGAIGVVFGDIGTSPLYTLRECLKAAGGVSQANVFGIVSLILWSILIVVTLKYVSFVMRADNDGEGGILALTALASGVAPERLRKVLADAGRVRCGHVLRRLHDYAGHLRDLGGGGRDARRCPI